MAAGVGAGWPQRTWALEGVGGLGHLLATGDTNKNDPNDARSVAIAALRSASCRDMTADDHAAVLKVWSMRHRDLGRARNQVACVPFVLAWRVFAATLKTRAGIGDRVEHSKQRPA